MINDVFRVLRDALLDHVRRGSGFLPTEAAHDLIVFPSSDKPDAVDIKLGAVTMLLVNLEEDRRALPADPYRRTMPDGTTINVKMAVPLNLYILYIARFSDYLESLKYVGMVAQFFQANRVITRESMPALNESIDKLVCELITSPITEDNHVFRTLSTPYQPSLLYRVKMVVFHDALGAPAAPPGAPIVGVNQ